MGRRFIQTWAELRRAFGAQIRDDGRRPAFPGLDLPRTVSSNSKLHTVSVPGLCEAGTMPGPIACEVTGGIDPGETVRMRLYESLESPRPMLRNVAIQTTEGETCSALFLYADGPFAGARWLSLGVTSHDLFPKSDAMSQARLIRLVAGLLERPFIAGIQPRFTANGGHATMEVDVLVSQGSQSSHYNLETRLLPLSPEAGWEGVGGIVEINKGETVRHRVMDVPLVNFDWKRFRIECRLRMDGKPTDQHAVSLNVQETMEKLCERFLAVQRQRGDGAVSGVAYADNRAVRGLLGAYEITEKRAYLEAAKEWGRMIVARQREDGGYRMGYGTSTGGEPCYVADGGEIACGIGRLTSYLPPDESRQFAGSLARYMSFRDSFRCPAGGIGIGWSLKDFSKSPPLNLGRVARLVDCQMTFPVGCSMAAAVMHHEITGDPENLRHIVRDGTWWLDRMRQLKSGAQLEGVVWLHAFVPDEEMRELTRRALQEKFLPVVLQTDAEWWLNASGRYAIGLDGLAYFAARVESAPKVQAALARAAWHVASPDSATSLRHLLARQELSLNEWLYLTFSAVSLPGLIEPEITRKPFVAVPVSAER